MIIAAAIYKRKQLKRLIAPKFRKKNVEIGDFLSELKPQDARKEEEQDDITVNPVVAARMLIEADAGKVKPGGKKGAGQLAKGGLRKLERALKRPLAGSGGKKGAIVDNRKIMMLNLDRQLKKDALATTST